MRRHNELADLRAYRLSPTIPTARSLVLGTRPRLRALMTKSPGTNTATPTIKTNLTSTTNEFQPRFRVASLRCKCHIAVQSAHISAFRRLFESRYCFVPRICLPSLVEYRFLLLHTHRCPLSVSPVAIYPVYSPYTFTLIESSRLSIVFCSVLLDVPCDLLSSPSIPSAKYSCLSSCIAIYYV